MEIVEILYNELENIPWIEKHSDKEFSFLPQKLI
jgi:hypothetical protein